MFAVCQEVTLSSDKRAASGEYETLSNQDWLFRAIHVGVLSAWLSTSGDRQFARERSSQPKFADLANTELFPITMQTSNSLPPYRFMAVVCR